MKVRDIMTRDVKTVGPDEDARDVFQKFLDLGIHHIPVVEKGKPVGIISTSDYQGMIHSAGKGDRITADMVFGGIPVRSLMTRDPLCLPPEAPVEKAASLMLQQEVHALPVVEKGQLAGIVTDKDLLSAVASGRLSE